MSWRLLKKVTAASVAIGSIGGVSYGIGQFILNETKTVFSATAFVEKPSDHWDHNWDHRAETSLIPLSDGTVEKEKRAKRSAGATRHIILFRHGQYNLKGATDAERILTEQGRDQAKFAGQRLSELQLPITEFVISTMARAQETGKIILSQLSDKETFPIRNDSLLEEGAPIPPIPEVGHWRPENAFFQDGSRIEAAFRAHFHRAPAQQLNDSYTILVCHANVIRYFVCRALQFAPEGWLRMSLHHASMTWITIYPNGRVSMRLLGDCGFMPKQYLSTR